MLFIIFALLVFSFHKASSLQCYEYIRHDVNFWIDSKTIPPFPTEESLFDAENQCTAMVRWFTSRKGKTSYVRYLLDYSFDSLPKGSSFSFVQASVERNLQSGSTRTLIYSCTTDYCNNRTNLQKILNALTLEEDFAKLDALFSNDTTGFSEQSSCINFSNATHLRCPPSASHLWKCRACLLMEMKSPEEFCARCPERIPMMDDDYVLRQVFFFFENQTRVADQIKLACRTKGCNALANVELIHQLSKLEFNFNNSPGNSPIIFCMTLNLILTLIFKFYN